MNASAQAHQPVRRAPSALWQVARAFLHTLHALFGGPEDIAADHTLMANAYRELLSWLRCAEAMLRRLLLIEAAHYVEPPASSRHAMRKPRQRKLVYFYPDKPEAWRVTFHHFVSSPARGESVIALRAMTKGAHGPAPSDRFATPSPASGGGKRLFDAWPLALRYEALIRVFNDPASYARRLARRLRAKPDRTDELLRAPPEAVHRIDDFEEMGERAKASAAAFSDTS